MTPALFGPAIIGSTSATDRATRRGGTPETSHLAIQVTNGPEQVPQLASEAGRRRRLRENMRAKTGAQKPLRESKRQRTPPSWGSGRGSKPRYGGSGVLPRSVTTICLSLIRCKRGGPMESWPSLASLYPQLCRSTWLEIRNGNFAASPARATIR